jgi:hypothetical protein
METYLIASAAAFVAGVVLTRLYYTPTLRKGKEAEERLRQVVSGSLSKLADKIK